MTFVNVDGVIVRQEGIVIGVQSQLNHPRLLLVFSFSSICFFFFHTFLFLFTFPSIPSPVERLLCVLFPTMWDPSRVVSYFQLQLQIECAILHFYFFLEKMIECFLHGRHITVLGISLWRPSPSIFNFLFLEFPLISGSCLSAFPLSRDVFASLSEIQDCQRIK